MSEVKLEELVQSYLTIRDERYKLKHEYESKDAEIKSDLEKLEQAMLSYCNDINADSIRTGSGTVIKSIKETFICNDWDNFKSYILDNQALDLLQQRISDGNLKEFLSTRQSEGLPPGISTMREVKVTVRKPSSRAAT